MILPDILSSKLRNRKQESIALCLTDRQEDVHFSSIIRIAVIIFSTLQNREWLIALYTSLMMTTIIFEETPTFYPFTSIEHSFENHRLEYGLDWFGKICSFSFFRSNCNPTRIVTSHLSTEIRNRTWPNEGCRMKVIPAPWCQAETMKAIPTTWWNST